VLNALIITPWYGGTQGGVAVATESLAHALLETGGDCAIILVMPDGLRATTSRGSAGEEIVNLCVRAEASRVGSMTQRLGYRLRAWNAERIMRRLIRAHDLRVAHFHFTDPGYDVLMRLARKLGLGIVTTFHGAEVNSELQDPATSAAVRAMIRSSDRVTVVSQTLLDRVITSVPEAIESLSLIHNTVPTSFARATGDASSVRAETKPRWDVLLVGSLIHRKGGDVLLDALAEVVHVLPHTRVAFAGTGDFETTLREQAVRLGLSGSVDFLGGVSRGALTEVYRQSRILAVPSRSEGLPLVLLEAQWLGIPAVASAVDGLPEAIADGENGLLVPAEDPPELARALIRALSDGPLYEWLRANALRIAGDRFSPAVMARRFQEVYAAAVRRKLGEARPRRGSLEGDQ
jgi:glycosyltransferase involved in cell wall biosynthesis